MDFFTTKESLNNQSVNDNNVVTECLHLPQKIDSSFLMKMTKKFLSSVLYPSQEGS